MEKRNARCLVTDRCAACSCDSYADLLYACIAKFMMTVKEREFKTVLAISGFIFPSAFLAGIIVNALLTTVG